MNLQPNIKQTSIFCKWETLFLGHSKLAEHWIITESFLLVTLLYLHNN